MNKAMSLITLCIGAIKDAVLDEENGNLHLVYVLPPELFNQIIPNLPPLALQNLQHEMPSVNSDEDCSSDDCLKQSIKRKSFEKFEIAWKTLYKLRWKGVQQDESTTNWQQIYWEKHLQKSNNLQKDDTDCLKYAMVYMPNLEVLDLSSNPLKNDGIGTLVPYFVEKSKSDTLLAELYLENCWFSHYGASQLLSALTTLIVPLKFLSIGDNPLLSLQRIEFGTFLGRLLLSGIQGVDVRGTGLGLPGFASAQREIYGKLSLASIDVSGGVRTASSFSKLMLNAPNLVSVKTSSNWIPVESVPTICSFIKAAMGNLGI